MTHLIILFLMGLTLGGALLAILIRPALYAVFGLGIALMGVAGLYFALGSPFVGSMQILIYIGGIAVLLVFAVMLSASIVAPRPERRGLKTVGAFVAAVLFLVAVLRPLLVAPGGTPSSGTAQAWSVEQLGHTLLGPYVLAFEVLSLLLVVAIMGAILIGRKEEEQP